MPTMFDVRESTVDELMQSGQAETLFAEHWDELASHKSILPLRPNVDHYRTLESTGMLLILTAWADEVMVGYSVNFMTPTPHFGGLLVVSNDLLFLSKPYRKGTGLGRALLKATEAHGLRRGGKLMMWLAKPESPLAWLMDKLGYVPQEMVFTKGL